MNKLSKYILAICLIALTTCNAFADHSACQATLSQQAWSGTARLDGQEITVKKLTFNPTLTTMSILDSSDPTPITVGIFVTCSQDNTVHINNLLGSEYLLNLSGNLSKVSNSYHLTLSGKKSEYQHPSILKNANIDVVSN